LNREADSNTSGAEPEQAAHRAKSRTKILSENCMKNIVKLRITMTIYAGNYNALFIFF
jgi:hypothetical protein